MRLVALPRYFPAMVSCGCLHLASLRTFTLALLVALVGSAATAHAERLTLDDRRTAFQRLTVIEDTVKRERYLYSDDMRYMQGMHALDRPDSLGPDYLRSALLGLAFATSEPVSMLFVGLGAGSMPRYLASRYPHARLDAVEIDPEVPPIARRYFALPVAPNLKVIIAEGREFIRSKPRQYNFVLIDAYFGEEIPPHLATVEFMAELRGVVRRGGVVVANLPAPELAANFWAVLATYRASFPHVRVFATGSPVNFILLASNTKIALDAPSLRQRVQQLKWRHRIDVDLEALAALVPHWEGSAITAAELHDANTH